MPLPPLVIMGVSGSGKSTVAEGLAERVDGAEYIDGDDLHPPMNRMKMAAGHPLDDADRAPWLDEVGRVMAATASRGRTPIMACSALKRIYRRRILAQEPKAFFVLLDVEEAELQRRMRARRGHFMPRSLLASQLATLEPLGEDEPGATLSLGGSRAQVEERILALVTAAR